MSTIYKKTYHAWLHAKDRCTNPANPKWGSYGGRGIQFSADWGDFQNFLRDMGYAPEGFSLGRIDNSAGYEKGNCRWETALQQALNRRGCGRSGKRGISLVRGKFMARGTLHGVNTVLYYGPSEADALEARAAWDKAMKKEFL